MSARIALLGSLFFVVSVVAGADEPNSVPASDWPCWRGPQRNAISPETGLLSRWPAQGPTLVWTAEGLGRGHSTPSVAGGRVFGLGDRGDDEVVWALDSGTGKELWQQRIAGTKREVKLDPGLPRRGAPGQPNRLDPRSSPAVANGRVYALGIMGDLVCLEAATGKLHWSKNLVDDQGGAMHYHGYAESPLLDGDHVIVSPGGSDSTLVALEQKTGKLVWQCRLPGDRAHYSSAIGGELGDQRMIIQFLEKCVVGIDPADGKFLWRVDRPRAPSYSIATPLFEKGELFVADSSGGGTLSRLAMEENGIKVTPVYTTTRMRNHHGGMVLVDGYLYGCSGVLMTCIDFRTGKEAWSERGVGSGSMIYADGHLYVRGERGGIALVEANAKQYVEKGRFSSPRRSGTNAWSHPVIAGGKLFLRDQDLLFCYEIQAAK